MYHIFLKIYFTKKSSSNIFKVINKKYYKDKTSILYKIS